MKKNLILGLFLAVIILVGATMIVSAACTDSDSGTNVYKKGTASSSAVSYTDACISSNSLSEANCNGANAVQSSATCVNGCSNGACVVNSCTDTDNGKKYNIAGTVSVDGFNFGDDFCNGNTLYEYYCSQKIPNVEQKNCGSCTNGIGTNCPTSSATVGSEESKSSLTKSGSSGQQARQGGQTSSTKCPTGWDTVAAAEEGDCCVKATGGAQQARRGRTEAEKRHGYTGRFLGKLFA